ncbi:hypothetical protein HY546_00250 [archaeon]|nr:hypothetical protein [archaeon]
MKQLQTQTVSAQVYSDPTAYDLVVGYLKGLKQGGTKDFTILDLIVDLKLPTEQARHIMDQLESEKKIHPIE